MLEDDFSDWEAPKAGDIIRTPPICAGISIGGLMAPDGTAAVAMLTVDMKDRSERTYVLDPTMARMVARDLIATAEEIEAMDKGGN